MNAQLQNPAITSVDAPAFDLGQTLARMREAHAARVPDHEQRMADLARLREAFKARLPDFVAAMDADFGRRSRHESMLTDGMTVLNEIDHIRAKLKRWMRPKRRLADWLFWPATTEIRYQPLGVVGIISPWNYPVNLALMPLAAALAAGNHVMLKPSEHTPRTSALLKEFLGSLFPETQVAVVLGEAEVAAAFSALPFDHLFFTGSTEVGRHVMAAAAKNLTPVTLELGGKSPAIVAPDYPIETAVARIAAGKWLNAGQTCIAPDYVLLPPSRIEAFVEAMRAYVRRAYPEPANSPDFTSVASERQFQRLTAWLAEARARGANVIELGDSDPARRVLAPTLVVGAPADVRLMQEEIFGPILPLVPADSVDAAIAYVNAHPRPLALYHFDHDAKRVRRVLDRTIAGGVSINDTVMHIAQSELPFGGVGPSGMGAYHGHAGFLTFSKQKPVLYQARISSLALMRPPYGKLADLLLRFLTR
jgi:coniferyl-aldehyde dehydrogenase